MIYVKTPLTREVREAVALTWGVTGEGQRLHGGEESAAYRLDGHVIRVGPAWRAAAESEGCHAIARHAAAGLPEAVAPLPAEIREPSGIVIGMTDVRIVGSGLTRTDAGLHSAVAGQAVRQFLFVAVPAHGQGLLRGEGGSGVVA